MGFPEAWLDMAATLDFLTFIYLSESDALAGIHNIDHLEARNCRRGSGHVGALARVRDAATLRLLIDLDEVCYWQWLVVEEQVRFGHSLPAQAVGVMRGPSLPVTPRLDDSVSPAFEEVPLLLSGWRRALSAALADVGREPVSDVVAAEIIGDFLQSFIAIRPFVDGNGRVSRLVADYIALYLGKPLLIFPAHRQLELRRAEKHHLAMRAYTAERLRECILLPGGEVRIRTFRHPDADEYRGRDGEIVRIDRSELARAQATWERASR